jgi:hypothetical protein
VLVARPSAHRTNSMSAIVHNIVVLLSIYEFLVTSLEYHSMHATPRTGPALWGVTLPSTISNIRLFSGSRHQLYPSRPQTRLVAHIRVVKH